MKPHADITVSASILSMQIVGTLYQLLIAGAHSFYVFHSQYSAFQLWQGTSTMLKYRRTMADSFHNAGMVGKFYI